MRLSLSKFLQLKFNVFVYQNLGMGLACFYIMLLGKLYFFFNRNEKCKIEGAIEAVFTGLKSRPEIDFIKKNVLRGIFYHYYEKLFHAYKGLEELKSFFEYSIKASHLGKLDNALRGGSGVLFITGHYGAIEYIPFFLALNQYPVSAVGRFPTKQLKDAVYWKAKEAGFKIIDATQENGVLSAISKELAANRIVFFQCDEIEKWKPSQNEKMFFLGKMIGVDRTINLIQRRTGAEIVFGILHRFSLRRYSLIMENYQDILLRLGGNSFSTGKAILEFFEQYIYSYPEEWYQWKGYANLKSLPIISVNPEKQTFTPLFKPALSEVS